MEASRLAKIEGDLERLGLRMSARGLSRRALEALEQMLSRWPPPASGEELSVQEAEALRRGGLDLTVRDYGDRDPLLRSILEYLGLVEASITVAQAAARLGVSPAAIRRQLARGSLYGLWLPSGWRVCGFQFEDGRLVPGIARVLEALPRDLHPLEVIGWLMLPDPDLATGSTEQPTSPLEWLRAGGDPRPVIVLAAGLDEDL